MAEMDNEMMNLKNVFGTDMNTMVRIISMY